MGAGLPAVLQLRHALLSVIKCEGPHCASVSSGGAAHRECGRHCAQQAAGEGHGGHDHACAGSAQHVRHCTPEAGANQHASKHGTAGAGGGNSIACECRGRGQRGLKFKVGGVGASGG